MTKQDTNKAGVVILLCVLSLIGFMVKLPRVLHYHDKELHALFYFCAALVLNYLYGKRSFGRHLLIFIILLYAGIFIEYAQEFSNHLVRKRIHGTVDPTDVFCNMLGLFTYSCLWAMWRIVLIFKDLANGKLS